ncbi:MAG: geranylgeranyl reductase family protein [Corynebacteriales bacterium]|nr:geranylgeranyl reductase family protein [Mycobacteriales bacterium]
MSQFTESADVIVVGAGPGGSAAAHYLAQSGLDVLLLEKTSFPREKVCGDGLTPRSTKALLDMGIDLEDSAWIRNKGLRIIGGDRRLEIPWPELNDTPSYGLVRTREDFDEILAKHAEKSGARLMENVNVTGPVLNEKTDRIIGVTTKDGRAFGAPLVIAADGNSSRLSLAMGLQKRDDRPMGVAVRTYYPSRRHDDDWLESWLELWDGDKLLPGYGWIFGVGDGTSNIGLGMLNTSDAFGKIDYRELLTRWLANVPEFTGVEPTGPVRGAALPMGFNRTPHYTRGMLLVGDAGGMVNPFNGEGIAYAMESGEIAARTVVDARRRATPGGAEESLRSYPERLKDAYGGYYTLGRYFVKLIGDPRLMKVGSRAALSTPMLMKFTLKLLANLAEPRGGDAMDRVINALTKVAPAA